jgi:Domain of unknown function (DUF1877)
VNLIMEYVRIRADEYADLRRLLVDDPDGAFDFVDALADGSAEDVPAQESRSMDTDRSWAAIGYLLGRAGPRPVDVIRGGTRLTEDEWGSEPPRYLDPAEVALAAADLADIPFDQLAAHYDPAAMAEVYPGIWANDWAQPYLRDWYQRITAFFQHAAGEHDGMIAYLT